MKGERLTLRQRLTNAEALLRRQYEEIEALKVECQGLRLGTSNPVDQRRILATLYATLGLSTAALEEGVLQDLLVACDFAVATHEPCGQVCVFASMRAYLRQLRKPGDGKKGGRRGP